MIMAWTDGTTEIYSRAEELEEENRELQAEIKKLKQDKYRLQKALNQSEDYRIIAESAAIEKFWIKVRAYAVVMGCYHIVEYGDSVIKEMVGEQL